MKSILCGYTPARRDLLKLKSGSAPTKVSPRAGNYTTVPAIIEAAETAKIKTDGGEHFFRTLFGIFIAISALFMGVYEIPPPELELEEERLCPPDVPP